MAQAVTSTARSAKNPVETTQAGRYHIVRFSYGDTFPVNMNGTEETIRFIGVDTPETHNPCKKVQCGGPAASAYTKISLTAVGSTVGLATDGQSSNSDRNNRLPRYVYLPDGTF